MHKISRVLVILRKRKKADKNTYELIIAQCYPFEYFNTKKIYCKGKIFLKKGLKFLQYSYIIKA